MQWLRNKTLKSERNQDKQHFWENLDCQESDARMKTKRVLTESSSAKRRLSVETAVGRIKPLGSEKYEFDYRAETKTLNIFKIFLQ